MIMSRLRQQAHQFLNQSSLSADQHLILSIEQRELTPELIVQAYCHGLVFSTSQEDGEVKWSRPDHRGVIPLENDSLTDTLKQQRLQQQFVCTFNRAFNQVYQRCSQCTNSKHSPRMLAVFDKLHLLGSAHSVEIWQNDQLVGGLYGFAWGRWFLVQGIFHQSPHADVVALIELAVWLKGNNYLLLELQCERPAPNPLGFRKISQAEFQRRLMKAITGSPAFSRPSPNNEVEDQVIIHEFDVMHHTAQK